MSTLAEQPLLLEEDAVRDAKVYEKQFIPGWVNMAELAPEPVQDFAPYRWSWREGRELLLASTEYVDPSKSERRNIKMSNPSQGKTGTVNTMHCSYQMILPGEFARAHRHTLNAGRFVLESAGAFTTLNGKKLYMQPNDVVLTPNWHWHGLGNDSPDAVASWVDFLDAPLMQLLKPSFFEVQPKVESDLPVSESSPFVFRWKDIDKRLDDVKPDPGQRHGRRLVLEQNSIPSMRLSMERLESGGATKPHRTTASHMFVCVTGEGTTVVEGEFLNWGPGDVVAVPSWKLFQHQTTTDSTLFNISDEPVLEMLNWLRESET